MFCSECGKEVKDGAKFCNFCGANQIFKNRVSTKQEENINGFESHTLGVDKSIKKTLRLILYGFGYGVIILCTIGFLNKLLTEGKFDPKSLLPTGLAIGLIYRIKDDKDLN